MYRGIIQEGTWVGKGSYLRSVVDQKGYDKFVQKGRIYRIYHEDMKPGSKPHLLGKTTNELIAYLSHPNGWWRMTAQKLLILKGDKAVLPALKKILAGNEGFFARIFKSKKDFGLERLHALWTLEGLGSIDRQILKTALEDDDHRVRVAAIRISEPYLAKQDAEILKAISTMVHDKHPEVAQQLLLSLRVRNADSKNLVHAVLKKFAGNELIEVTAKENLNPSFSEIQSLRDKYKLRPGDAALQIVSGYRMFQETCAACHGKEGKGTPQLAPSLVGSPRLTGDAGVPIKILLHGLTGPVDGVEYNGPMAPVAQYNDEELSDILSYIREHLNGSGTVWRGQVRSIREQYKGRNTYWTLDELTKDEQKNLAQKKK
jgi:mono/diheme cytochrome c family protein